MRTMSEQKQIISLMLMEMFLDGDERGSVLIEAAHSYLQSAFMDDVDVSDSALNLYMSIKTSAEIEGALQ